MRYVAHVSGVQLFRYFDIEAKVVKVSKVQTKERNFYWFAKLLTIGLNNHSPSWTAKSFARKNEGGCKGARLAL